MFQKFHVWAMDQDWLFTIVIKLLCIPTALGFGIPSDSMMSIGDIGSNRQFF
jgi:hypothetical protein